MWRDICLANRAALIGELDRYREQLDELRGALLHGDGAVLEKVFEEARVARRAWGSQGR
jgi:prephenate dehydrogenase